MNYLSFGVREFQAHLGEALRAAQRGDQVLITSRGRAVAVLTKAGTDKAGGIYRRPQVASIGGPGEAETWAAGTNPVIPSPQDQRSLRSASVGSALRIELDPTNLRIVATENLIGTIFTCQ